MKKLLIALAACYCLAGFASNTERQKEDTLKMVSKQCQELENRVDKLQKIIYKQQLEVRNLQITIDGLQSANDSLALSYTRLSNALTADKNAFNKKLNQTNVTITTNYSKINAKGMWTSIAFLLIIIVFGVYLWQKRKSDKKTISKIQEDSIKLDIDKKLLELLDKQMNVATIATQTTSSKEFDHSLALKVADEIVRIEMNLSRMDASVRGYKQLQKAVQRIKDNFNAKGYEIVDMLGKPYNEGMKVTANFVPDGTLKEGQQIITGIIKPQINYNGKMIQSAQITVSQNI